MATQNYKGFQIRTFQDDDEWFVAIDDGDTTIASTMDEKGSSYRDGTETEGNALRKGKATVRNILRKGY